MSVVIIQTAGYLQQYKPVNILKPAVGCDGSSPLKDKISKN